MRKLMISTRFIPAKGVGRKLNVSTAPAALWMISMRAGMGTNLENGSSKNSPKTIPKTMADIPATMNMFAHCLMLPVDLSLTSSMKAVSNRPCPTSPNIIPKKIGKT